MLLAYPLFQPAMSADPFEDFLTPSSAASQSTATTSSSAIGDLSDTADQLDTVALTAATTAPNKQVNARSKRPAPASRPAPPARKRNQRAEKPAMTVDEAIAQGLPKQELDALLKEWTRFTLQEARDKAKAATVAMEKSAAEGRRKIADELLKLADAYGCTMEQAKTIYTEALAAKFGKAKGR